MTLLDLLARDGYALWRKASTGGGEYAGSCPWCGGIDRFVVWPFKGDRGAYWCRVCGHSGDALQYLRDCRRMSFRDACALLGADVRKLARSETNERQKQVKKSRWKTADTALPCAAWQERAQAIVQEASKTLASEKGIHAVRWLQRRGLSEKTIFEGRLGLILQSGREPRTLWGLPESGSAIWLPIGLTIPSYRANVLMRLRIRRWNPQYGPRYVVVSGSVMAPLVLGTASCCVIVESELDALLLHQIAGNIATVIALGSAQTKPDRTTDCRLKAANKILITLDADEAGARHSWTFWLQQYRQAIRWPPIRGKDPSEMAAHGNDFIWSWLTEGLQK